MFAFRTQKNVREKEENLRLSLLNNELITRYLVEMLFRLFTQLYLTRYTFRHTAHVTTTSTTTKLTATTTTTTRVTGLHITYKWLYQFQVIMTSILTIVYILNQVTACTSQHDEGTNVINLRHPVDSSWLAMLTVSPTIQYLSDHV